MKTHHETQQEETTSTTWLEIMVGVLCAIAAIMVIAGMMNVLPLLLDAIVSFLAALTSQPLTTR